MRSEQETREAVRKYSDMIRRICMVHLKSYHDTEDIFQTVFLKYVLASDEFASEEHEKAWFIRVTINACRDLLRNFFRSRTVSIEEVEELAGETGTAEDSRVREEVLLLPDKYKDAVYLHYFEGYSAAEIAKLLGKKENTVYSLLSRGRDILSVKLGGGIDG
jgi:RNA polymerase sigma factor (sigma-70 family)